MLYPYLDNWSHEIRIPFVSQRRGGIHFSAFYLFFKFPSIKGSVSSIKIADTYTLELKNQLNWWQILEASCLTVRVEDTDKQVEEARLICMVLN